MLHAPIPACSRLIRGSCALAALVLLVAPAAAQPSDAEQPSDIEEVSLDDLLSVQVSAASKYEQDAREAPASVAVISADDIARYGYRTLAEALASVRGLYLTDDLEYAYVGVRGFSRPGEYNNRVLIQIDGQTVNEIGSGFAYIDERLGVDLEAVERIEVVRGPGSSLYGSGAMLAVVNVVMKGPAELGGLRVTATGGDAWRGSAAAGIQKGDVAASVSVLGGDYGGREIYFPEFDAPETNGGVAERLDWRRYGSARATVSAGHLTLTGHYSALANGSPAAPARRVFNSDETQTAGAFGVASADYAVALGARAHLGVHLALDRISLRHRYHVFSQSKQRFEVDTDELIAWEPSATTEVVWDVTPQNRLIVGAGYHYGGATYQLFDDGAPPPDLRLDLRAYAASAFLQNEHRFSRRLTLTLGLRADQFAEGLRALVPRAVAVYHLGRRAALKAMTSTAFRAPNLVERNFQNPGIGIIVNPDLGPERVHTTEATWEHRWSGALSSAVAAYRYNIRGLIDLGINPDVGSIQYQNLSRARTTGAELELNLRPDPEHHVYLRYAFQRAEGEADELSNSPTHVLRVGGYALLGRVSVAPEFHVESGRRTVRGTRTDGFALLRVAAQVRLGSGFRAQARACNVLGARYAYPGGFDHRQHALAQPGRTLSLGLSYRP